MAQILELDSSYMVSYTAGMPICTQCITMLIVRTAATSFQRGQSDLVFGGLELLHGMYHLAHTQPSRHHGHHKYFIDFRYCLL